MNIGWLLEMGVSDDIARRIMSVNGDDIENVRRELNTVTAERDGLQTQLSGLQGQLDDTTARLETFSSVNVDELQGRIAALISDLETERNTHARDLLLRDRRAEIATFIGGFKWVNDETRDHYAAKLESALDSDASKGKSMKELLDPMINGEDGQPRPGLFMTEEAPHRLIIPPSGSNKNPYAGMTKEQFAKLSYEQKVQLKTDHPELYQTFK